MKATCKKGFFLLIFTLVISNSFFISNSVAEVSVVVHPDNGSTFDKSVIKKIFLGKSKLFKNGRNAILISPKPGDPVRNAFNQEVLNKSETQVNAYWARMQFTGKGSPPQEMNSAQDIISAISENKDAISYLDSSAVTSDVKVVAKF